MNDEPIPLSTTDLVGWLRRRYPEFSPRRPDQTTQALARGAQLDLIDAIELELERLNEEDD